MPITPAGHKKSAVKYLTMYSFKSKYNGNLVQTAMNFICPV